MSHQAVTWALQQPNANLPADRKAPPGTWVDVHGRAWPLPQRHERLDFKRQAHAALRAYVYARDGYCCGECGAEAAGVPPGYDGHKALFIEAVTRNGHPIPLVLDHEVSLANGGATHPDNLRTLCATCNNHKATAVDRIWRRR